MQIEIKQKHMDTTAVYRGKSDITRDCVTGKLMFVRVASDPLPSDCAVIPVFAENVESRNGEALWNVWNAFSAVAVIFIGDTPPRELRESATAHRLPLLLLHTLPDSHHGKIAILDSRNATLLVNPDIETLDRYARKLRPEDYRPFPLSATLTPCYRSVSLSPSHDHSPQRLMLQTRLCDRVLLSKTEEELFEEYRELAEHTRECPLAIVLSVAPSHASDGMNFHDPLSDEENDGLRTCIRALLRAAVYGSFSFYLEGLLTKKALYQAQAVWSSLCLTLEKEGREYNRDLPLGFLIGTPLPLRALDDPSIASRSCLELGQFLQCCGMTENRSNPTALMEEALHMIACLSERTLFPECVRMDHLPLPREQLFPLLYAHGSREVYLPL